MILRPEGLSESKRAYLIATITDYLFMETKRDTQRQEVASRKRCLPGDTLKEKESTKVQNGTGDKGEGGAPKKANTARETKTDQWLYRHKQLRQRFLPILCNWLVELHFELFTKETRRLLCKDPLEPIHIAMKHLHRYMSVVDDVHGSRLQLVGVSCYQITLWWLVSDKDLQKVFPYY